MASKDWNFFTRGEKSNREKVSVVCKARPWAPGRRENTGLPAPGADVNNPTMARIWGHFFWAAPRTPFLLQRMVFKCLLNEFKYIGKCESLLEAYIIKYGILLSKGNFCFGTYGGGKAGIMGTWE